MLEASDPPLPEPLDRTAQVIAQLIELAKEMREAHRRGEALGLTEDELASTTPWRSTTAPSRCWATKRSERSARELVEAVKKNVSIDWSVKESAKAKLRTIIKRLLRKHGYPPDMQEKATQTVPGAG